VAAAVDVDVDIDAFSQHSGWALLTPICAACRCRNASIVRGNAGNSMQYAIHA
jgi:hypothetical protein